MIIGYLSFTSNFIKATAKEFKKGCTPKQVVATNISVEIS